MRAAVFALSLVLAGCGRPPEPPAAGRIAVSLQSDWYPQPEHGGFHQALARGFYREAGLDVTILPGGPRSLVLQKVGAGQVEFALWRSDDVTVAVSRGLPVKLAAGIFQRDPQALMFHRAHPVRSFDDLHGRLVMAGASSVWVPLVERRHGISIRRTPVTFSIAQFLQDPLLVQQCLVTSEPYQAAVAGAEVDTLLVADSGYEPYHALVVNAAWLAAHPEAGAAFVRATLRGWADFLHGDPAPAFAAIAALNPGHDAGSMAFSREAILRLGLVEGGRPGERIGHLDVARLDAQARLLHEFGLMDREVRGAELVAPGFPLE